MYHIHCRWCVFRELPRSPQSSDESFDPTPITLGGKPPPRLAIAVARATSSSCPGVRPWEQRVLGATIEAAHLTRVSSKCGVMLRSTLSVTPSTLICVTLAAPGITSGGVRHVPPPLLYISFESLH